MPLTAVAAAAMLALAVTASRYGYHRDELYFIAAGAHPAWGYPDQPLFSPLLARGMDLLAPGSLLALRAPAILACGITTFVTGLIAREAGGTRRAQAIAAACWAGGAVCLVTGHFLTTTTYDVCATAVVFLFIARALRTGDPRWWLPAGLVLGIALLNKTLIAVLVAVVVLGVAFVGPRAVLRSRWLVVGALLAVVGSLPYGLWQLAHGVPQTDLAHSIASSGDEGGRPGFIPFQIILIGPLVAPVWIAGLVRLWRDAAVRHLRAFGLAYVVLVPLFIVSGGKAYYMAGLYPVLLGAGAVPVDRWLGRQRGRIRVFAGALVLTAAISAVIGLCILPVSALRGSPVLALNPDSGEMVGWPRFTDQVAAVYRSLPRARRGRTAIFTQNYGEAGAIAHFGPSRGLPYPYSGHNGWALWGPPRDSDTSVLVVGLNRSDVFGSFTGCRLAARIDNGQRLDNDEQGAPLWTCTGERRPWSVLWPSLRHYD